MTKASSVSPTPQSGDPNRSIRLLVLANRFWPCVDDSTLRLMHWLDALKTQSIRSTVVTARHQAQWPDRFEIRGTPVHRLLPAPNSNWNESHFSRNVVQWIMKHSHSFDAIYCDRVDSVLSLLAVKGSKWSQPILARMSPYTSINGTFEPESQRPIIPIDAARRCDVVFTPNAGGHRFLVSQGVPDSKIVRLADPYWGRVERSGPQRTSALRSLASLNGDFFLPKETKLIVHLGISKWSALKPMLQHVCDLLDTGAPIRLWIINCGLPYGMVYDYLKDRGWHREILIFDGFDDQEVFLQAADLLWFTTPEESLQYSLPTAAASGIPLMIKETPEIRDFLSRAYPSIVYGSPTDLALNLNRWYASPESISADLQSLKQEVLHSANPTASLQRFASQCEMAIEAKRA